LLDYDKVKEKENINKPSRAGITALHAACRRENTIMVKLLLKVKEIDVNQKDKQDNTPLHAACAAGNTHIVSLLIDSEATIPTKNKHGMHPFHVAVIYQSVDVVKMIHTHSKVAGMKKQLLQDCEDDGNTMLLLAVKSGNAKIVNFLLENGAEIADKNNVNANVFHLAAEVNNLEILEMIYSQCNAVDVERLLEAKDSNSLTPFHYAARKNQKEILSFLIDR